MNSLIRKFATDPEKEKQGVVHPLGDGQSIRVARANNPLHVAILNKLREPYKEKLDAGVPIPEAEWKKMAAAAAAQAILLGWEGVTGADGQPLPYSVETAEQMLSDPEMADFSALVHRLSTNGDHFRKYSLKVAEKNSERPSAGAGNGPRKKASS